MKLADVKPSSYIGYGVEHNHRQPNLKLVITLKYQNTKIFFAKGYNTNKFEEVFVIKKVIINTVP